MTSSVLSKLLGCLTILLITSRPCASMPLESAYVFDDTGDNAFSCSKCDLENDLNFAKLNTRVREHSVQTTYTIDISGPDCIKSCIVFSKLPTTPSVVPQGNWSINRDGTISFHQFPHKTGVAMLNITVEEVSGDSNYTAHTAYRVIIEEEPDWPIVFASQTGVATTLSKFDNTTEQFRNVTFSVEQNTGNNTAYADLLVTGGAFDYDADENIRVEILTSADRPRLGQVIGGFNSSSATLLEPVDCDLASNRERLLNRSLTEWDVSLTRWHPCNLTLPYPPNELSWFTHLLRYRPGRQQSGLDRFVLTYTDKYGVASTGKLYVHVHILENPCVNGGRCRGPKWDPNCDSYVRSSGFFNNGYQCQCETGWVGDRCEIDFDDCSSSPCPSPYRCVDKFRGFECVCPENHVNCQPIMKPWQLSATILGIVVGVCIVTAIVILASRGAPIIVEIQRPKQSPTPTEAIPLETPPAAAAPVAAPDAVTEFNDSEDNGDDLIDIAEPAVLPAITFSEAEVQADLANEDQSQSQALASPSPAPSPSPSLSRSSSLFVPPRPVNPEPRPMDDRIRSYQRGSIMVPRRPSQVWSATEEDEDVRERLKNLRSALRNQQVLEEF